MKIIDELVAANDGADKMRGERASSLKMKCSGLLNLRLFLRNEPSVFAGQNGAEMLEVRPIVGSGN